MKVQFIGATHEVTGSCTLLEVGGRQYLIDCGMEQGTDIFENVPLPVAAGAIEAVFLPDMIKSRKEKDVKAHTAEAVSMPFEETKEVTASVPQPSDDKSSDVKIDQENGKEE